MINKYFVGGILLFVLVVISSYIINFYDHPIASDTGAWGELGDYIGGILNPILSFTSLVLLLKSLNLQNQANIDLQKQIKNSERAEKIRSFESLLFNMIKSQTDSFSALRIRMKINKKGVVRYSSEAVLEIEDEIHRMRDAGKINQDISNYIMQLDETEKIYSASRTFYLMIKMISQNLSDESGFEVKDREFYFNNVIAFTDFSLLRLIIIAAQFTDYFPTEYLKKNEEFVKVLEKSKLNFNLY